LDSIWILPVRLFFQEVADLSCSERERLFAERQIDPERRAEIESLLSFDSTSDHSITGAVNAAKAALKFDHHTGAIHWGSYRPVRILGAGGMGTVYLAERTDARFSNW
jgi:serine/threonine-protein kinase